MSSSVVKEERQKRRSLLLKPSSRAIVASSSALHAVNQSTRLTSSGAASPSRRSFSLGGSKVLDKSSVQAAKQAVRVFDEANNDVTPQPLYQAEAGGAVQPKASRIFLDEISAGSASEQTTTTGSFTMPFSRSVLGSSRISSQSTIESINEEIEDTFTKRDVPVSFPDSLRKKNTVKEQVTEDMLKVVIDVYISETDNISLLDIPSTFVSVDADDAEAVRERNNRYDKVCRNKIGNNKYTDRSTQTLNGAAKNKQVQSDSPAMVDAGTIVTTWDMYDTFCGHEQDQPVVTSPEPERAEYPAAVVDTSRAAERSVSVGSSTSTGSAGSSLKAVEAFGNSSNAETDLQLIMHSEKLQHSLLVMERSILRNTFQPQLAAYRQLPVLEDPDRPVKPGTGRRRQEEAEPSSTPALEHLWTFSCELSRGRSVSCMAWNPKNPDLLAVGYGDLDSQNPGLVCCWSLKNITWPERVIHCDSAVTSLDFSAHNPHQLAVGMQDGNIAIHSVHSQDENMRVSSRGCPNKHLGPVWQLRWTQQELSLTGDEKAEALFSVAADGRISKWFVFNNCLDCTDLMKLKRMRNTKKKGGTKTENNAESVLSAFTSALCFDFHPTDSSIYLVGTWEGLIHKCSCSNSQQFLETYKKHFCPVECVAWCPLSPDVFLSCSSDWTIQLWKQGQLSPVLGLASNQRAVCGVRWSPKWATVFGAVNEAQLEIWDLNSSILDPVIVQPAAPGVEMKSLLFATQTDCVLVGDSDGQVTVYQLKNLSLGEGNQVDILEGIIRSAI